MGQLAEAIAHVNARELDANEAAIASCFPPPPDVPPEARQHLIPFVQWCEAQRVRSLPARPASVAAFAQWQKDLGVPREKISASLATIEALHFSASLGNPCATPLVRAATSASTIEPPRSWTRAEKQTFTELPVEIQAVVARREQDRETTLRRGQNELAEMKKLLRLQTAPDNAKPVEVINEEIPMAKKEGHELGVGPYSKNDVKMTREPDKGYPKPVDISKKVDPSWSCTEGFSAALDKGKSE